MKLCERFGWRASASVLARKFVHRRFWGKAVASPDGRLRARYLIDFGSDSIRVDAVVMRGNGKPVCTRFITTVRPHWFFINDTLMPLKWFGSETVNASTRDGKQSWLLRLDRVIGSDGSREPAPDLQS